MVLRSTLTRNQISLIALVVIANVAEFFDMFLIGFVVALLSRQWQLGGLEVGIILAASGLGTVLGAIGWGRAADTIGRRRAMARCIALLSVFTLATVALPEGSWRTLAFLRVVVGAGVGGLNIVSIPYVAEFVSARRRGFLTGLASAFVPLGLFLGSVAQAAAGENWRVLMALGALPGLLLVWLGWVPESPRFLLSRGDSVGAQKALAWAWMVPETDVTLDDVGGVSSIRADGRIGAYARLWREHRRSVGIVAVGSFAFILGSFAIQSWGQTVLHDGYGIGVDGVARVFMVLSAVDLAGRLLAAWLADRLGRKLVLVVFGFFGALGCLVAAGGAASAPPAAGIFIAGIIIAMAFGDGAFGILNVFGGEQFPTAVRGTGLGLSYGIGASAKVIGPLLVGLLVGTEHTTPASVLSAVGVAFVLFAAFFAAGAVVYLAARETRGVEIDRLGEG
ncbi:putative MFS transporter [Arcanobacterium wilhelmae]|uniref:MFS transporter n=1 Tax=Arcanobacterium wilhelmae TaxID=1803177 RepID=A0ABT9NAI8_9ACTO|nr:MFS transporter [Arcanobacterium wilhelmae]MDP9800738.1 putative MFS transporter [Arcanobacterium wilhelmae]WFN90136.1 MFS transporter [Arcanobacterium wilhelmae]